MKLPIDDYRIIDLGDSGFAIAKMLHNDNKLAFYSRNGINFEFVEGFISSIGLYANLPIHEETLQPLVIFKSYVDATVAIDHLYNKEYDEVLRSQPFTRIYRPKRITSRPNETETK